MTCVLAVLVLIAASCSGSDDAALSPVDVSAAASSATSSTAVGASVDITLEGRTVGGDVNTFVPGGWILDEIGAATAPRGSPLSPASWRIDDRCLDPCEQMTSAEWEVAISEVEFSSGLFAGVGSDVVADVSTAGRRQVEVVDDSTGATHVRIARWVGGAAGYLVCEVSSQPASADALVAALEVACENTRAALDG